MTVSEQTHKQDIKRLRTSARSVERAGPGKLNSASRKAIFLCCSVSTGSVDQQLRESKTSSADDHDYRLKPATLRQSAPLTECRKAVGADVGRW